MTRLYTRRILVASAAIAVVGVGVWQWNAQRAAAPAASIPQSEIHNPQSLPLHPVVAKIVKEGPTMPYLKFNYVIKELPTNLAQHDVEALVGMLLGAKPEKFSEGEWGSITNDIQEALSVQVAPNARVAEALITIYRDEARTQMQRDYALQHIGGFAIYLVHTRDTRNGTLPEFFGSLVEELKFATQDGSKPWAGTAFNLLDGLLRAAEYRGTEVAGLNPDQLAAQAMKVATDAKAPLNARLPALQLASRRNAPEALPLARQILKEPGSGIMLVQCAAAVLGQHGGAEDLAFLQQQLAKGKPHTQAALSAAIQQLSKN